MKKPYFNREQRQQIIDNTWAGSALNLHLELKKLRRSMNWIQWQFFKWDINQRLKKAITFKGWNNKKPNSGSKL